MNVHAGMQHYQRLYGPRKLDRASLPTPARYLADNGLIAKRPRGEWAPIKCPTHKAGNETHASMNVSLVDGHFRCHVCGERGGDIVALHQRITGKGFLESVRDLGGRFE